MTSNRLNQVSSVVGPGGTSTYTHDANGNLTSDGALVFAYDEENRLRTVALLATPGTPFASYDYDPLGRRRAKVVNGVATRYLSDGAEEIEERDGSNALLRQFVNGAGIDEHLAIVDATLCAGGGRCFLRTNWQGSTTHLVAQSGALVETYHYGPYGERLDWTPQDGDSGNPYRYTGRRYDAETGLYYYRARYYSPKLGRFLQTDPIGTKDDVNLYAYAERDPTNRIDPSGLTEIVINVQRTAESRASTQSSVSVRSGTQTVTVHGLEPPSAHTPERTNSNGTTRIMPGRYDAFVRSGSTSRHGYDVVEMSGAVPGTDDRNHPNIQIHVGNSPDETLGCLLVGTGEQQDRVTGSRDAYNQIMELVRATQDADSKKKEATTIVIVVTDPPPPPPPPPEQGVER